MDPIYLVLTQKKQIHTQKAYLPDAAAIACADTAMTAKLQSLLLATFSGSKKERRIVTVTDIIKKIQTLYPSADITTLGETAVILEYVPDKQPSKALECLKVALVCLITFFGAAFTIITFNNDVSAGAVFQHMYTMFTGQEQHGISVLEVCYSLGLGLGIIGFFNHISGHRLGTDPTPIEVEMEQYETNTNKTLITTASREKEKQKETSK